MTAAHTILAALYERATGRPYWTTRHATAEYGPPPGAVHHRELAELGDHQLDALVRDLDPDQLRAHLHQLRRDRTHQYAL
ncbi:hypothetical protein F4553_005382 [Allocatelliglobosispora scoriae]|uniref:Uncharacterized protein n=1 Tax=Allocatelliglobosispora scoriae TaxID=643052 RepID=A0A841BYK3_9ACTN|nr:hypothetical protein [Allocatelliglobosispora scoriae]MBB5872003.1 hypothetical protein [Allocatelliglobosispora scoriae]